MSDHESPWVQAVARARRSIVRVQTAVGSGTGFFALANGIIVTSQELVQHEPVVALVTDEGRELEARVVAVDVRKDLALLLPREPIPAHPMHPAPTAPRLGDSVAVLAQSGSGPTITPALIRAVGVELEGLAHYQVDVVTTDAHRGAPLIDTSGRVIGVATRPRRAGMGALGVLWQESFLPRDAFDAELAAVKGPAAQLADTKPTYACPGCGAALSPELDRCLGCGVVLPSALALTRGDASAPPGAQDDDAAEGELHGRRVMDKLLSTLGIVANRVRRGPRTWRISLPSTQGGDAQEIALSINASGSRIVLQTPVVRLPTSDYEPFFRLLLTLNDETAGPYRLSLADDVVFLSAVEASHAVLNHSVERITQDLLSTAAHYRGVLSSAFGASGILAT